MEVCHYRLTEIQAKLHLLCEILFFSTRMNSFEVTSEQFDLKLPHCNHKPVQLSNDWRQVGYMKLSVFNDCIAIGIFQTLAWSHSLPLRHNILGWHWTPAVRRSIVHPFSTIRIGFKNSKYGLVILHYHLFHFECLSQLGFSL